VTRRLLSLAFPFMEGLDPVAPADTVSAPDTAFQMDEEAFRLFYTRTAGMLWAYLVRATGDSSVADDLLQEAYYRILRSGRSFESDDHQRNYLFRVATNLIRDRYRRPSAESSQLSQREDLEVPAHGDLAQQTQQRADLRRAMARLSLRERQLVWLAYGQGSSHEEIAGTLGLKRSSIKPLLSRARKKLARLLRS
jgi:RNA polymerase sigma-70 factor, ECF subfamily